MSGLVSCSCHISNALAWTTANSGTSRRPLHNHPSAASSRASPLSIVLPTVLNGRGLLVDSYRRICHAQGSDLAGHPNLEGPPEPLWYGSPVQSLRPPPQVESVSIDTVATASLLTERVLTG